MTAAISDGIGVCQTCSSLACGSHGGFPGIPPRQLPSFQCSRCLPGVLAVSAGGSPPPPGSSGGGGQATGPPGGSPAPGSGSGGGDASEGEPIEEPESSRESAGSHVDRSAQAFASSLDFELKLPVVAQASADRRGEIDIDSLRESLRRLFLLRTDQDARDTFLDRIRGELAEPVYDEIRRQMRQRDNARRYWEERGGEDAVARVESAAIVRRVQRWLREDLDPWMESIYPVLSPEVWVGSRDEVGGVIDLLLLADAVGLQAYSWNVETDRSPFRRLDVAAGADMALLVVSELYAQALPVYQ